MRRLLGFLLGGWLAALAATAGAAPIEIAPLALSPKEMARIRLERALQELAVSDTLQALEELERLDLRSHSELEATAELSRGAFLRAWLYRKRGDAEEGLALAGQLSPRLDSPSPFLRWVALQMEWWRAASSPSLEEARPQFEMLARNAADQALLLYLRGLSAEEAGAPAEAIWQELAGRDPKEHGNGELIACAALRMARIAAARGGDPTPWLRKAGIAEPGTPLSRRLVDAARHLDQGRYDLASPLYAALEKDLTAQEERLSALSEPAGREGLWADWLDPGTASELLVLDPASVMSAGETLARHALDLDHDPPAVSEASGLEAANRKSGSRLPVIPPPPADSLRRLVRIEAEYGECGRRAERVEKALARRAAELARLRRYFARGARRRAEMVAHLDSLRAAIAAARSRFQSADQTIDSSRIELARTFEARAELMTLRRAALSYRADRLRRFGIDAPGRRPKALDAPAASLADSVLEADGRLLAGADRLAADLAARLPGALAASWREIWGPDFAARIARFNARDVELAARAGRLESELALLDRKSATDHDPADLEAERERWVAERQGLGVEREALRAGLASSALAAARDRLAATREGIDYGLALTSYAAFRRTSLEESLATPGSAATPALTAARTRARADLTDFIEKHPESRALSAVRYWLGDLELSQGLFGGPDDLLPALHQFETIRREDPAYPHQDAVLFQIGMIKSDCGDASATEPLERLVADHPASPFVQEARLRLGEDAYATRNIERAIPFFARAAEGGDPALSVMALYRLGWAHSAAEQYAEAAEAFRRLLDAYSGPRPVLLKTDLRAEATDCLVQCLARAGGAKAFEAVFGDAGRDYVPALLDRLALALYEASLFRESVGADELFLRRYPTDALALRAATRLIAACEEGNRPEEALAAREAAARHFLPDRAWMKAQSSDSLRQAGASFARVALAEAALGHHRNARGNGDTMVWSKAASLYAEWLKFWRADGDAPRLHLYSGEAAEALERGEEALDHYTAAALADTGQWGTEALWSRAKLYQAREVPESAAKDFAAYRVRAASDPDRRLSALDLEIDAWHAAGRPGAAASRLLERIALRPDDPEVPVRLYRAGLDFAAAADTAGAERAWRRLIAGYPRHELTLESRLQIASTRLAARDTAAAAAEYEAFAGVALADRRAPDALLEALDLYDAAGDSTSADRLRLEYISRYPQDDATTLRLLEPLARRQLDRLGSEAPLNALEPPKKPKASDDPLARYLTLARKKPYLASDEFLARIDFMKAEIQAGACRRVRLTQPLARSIAERKARLGEALAGYARCSQRQAPRWARAAAFRSGQLLADFGEALEKSERPRGLTGDDLLAYNAVVEKQVWGFFDRAEKIWSDLLKETAAADDDAGGWIARTRATLWPRLAERFYFRPEAEYGTQDEGLAAGRATGTSAGEAHAARSPAPQPENPR